MVWVLPGVLEVTRHGAHRVQLLVVREDLLPLVVNQAEIQINQGFLMITHHGALKVQHVVNSLA